MTRGAQEADRSLDAALLRCFGFERFRRGQREVVEAALAGRDVLAVMPTGAGKSLCYQLPAACSPGVTLVVSPLIALMQDQVAASTSAVPMAAVNSAMTPGEAHLAMRAAAQGRLRLLYVAPERLRNARFREDLEGVPVDRIVVDEAHCVSEWGHDFRPEYLAVADFARAIGRPPMAAFTATATPQVREDIVRLLGLQDAAEFVTGFRRPNLALGVEMVRGDANKRERLTELAREGTGIVYVATKRAAEEVASELRDAGIAIEPYHAGLAPDVRERLLQRFSRRELGWVAATNAFGLGIDRADVRRVVHYQVPGSPEAYYQEAGRAGRDGAPAECILLYDQRDLRVQQFFIDVSYPDVAVVHAVWRALRAIEEDPIRWGPRDLATAMPSPQPHEREIEAALDWLSRSGHIERGEAATVYAKLRLLMLPREAMRSAARRPAALETLDRLIRAQGARLADGLDLDLGAFARRERLAPARVEADLEALRRSGALAFERDHRPAGIALKAEALDPHAVRALQEGKRRREAQLEEMVRYAHARRCRMSFVLEYFGDADSGPCGVCDNCLGSAAAAREAAAEPYDPQGDDRAIAGNLLLAVRRLEGRFGKSLVVKVLRGSRAKGVEERGLDRLSLYGVLRRFPQARVAAALDGLELRGLVAVEPGLYPTVRITPAGRETLERMRGEGRTADEAVGSEDIPSRGTGRERGDTPSPGAQRQGEGKGEGARGEPRPHGAHSDRERGPKVREQRREMTEAENRLWFHLRGHRLDGLKFRRQHPIGPWIVDFVCLSRRLIVEVDGGQHAERQAVDAERTESLEQSGFTVLRFWNDEVLAQTDAVLDRILTTVAEKSE